MTPYPFSFLPLKTAGGRQYCRVICFYKFDIYFFWVWWSRCRTGVSAFPPLSTLSSINSPPTVFSAKHIKRHLWYTHSEDQGWELIHLLFSIHVFPMTAGRSYYSVSDLSFGRSGFSAPLTRRAAVWWLVRQRWVQSSDLWPPALILLARYPVALPQFVSSSYASLAFAHPDSSSEPVTA